MMRQFGTPCQCVVLFQMSAHNMSANLSGAEGRDRSPEADPAPPGRGLRQSDHAPGLHGRPRRLVGWLAGRELDDAALAAYLAKLHDPDRASSGASMTVAAPRCRAKLAGQPTPAAQRTTDRRRPGAGRHGVRGLGPDGRARHLTLSAAARRVVSDKVALERVRLDAVIARLLFMAGCAATRWRDALGGRRRCDRRRPEFSSPCVGARQIPRAR